MLSWALAAIATIAASLAALWLALIVCYFWIKPDRVAMKEAARVPADVVVLVRRLLSSGKLPRGARVLLWILLGYLLMPIDIVPDFIPVIGFADDVIVLSILMRGAIRQVDLGTMKEAWPGSNEAFDVLRRVCRL